MNESEKNSTHAATWAEGGDGNSDRQGAYSSTDSIIDSADVQDHFAYLLNVGIPLDVVQKYQREGLSCEELAAAVKSMLDRGQTIAEIVGEEVGELPEAQPPPVQSLAIISAADLQQKNLPPIRWIVQDLLPAGLTILASPPKFGKSWMAMLLCLSVAYGGTFLGFVCCKCAALYLALEDGQRRLKSRMERILGAVPAPDNFHFATDAPSLSGGILEALEGHMKEHPDTGLIVVDTLQRIRDVGSGKDCYGRDYNDVGEIKKFADAHNVAVLIVHHLRKAGDDSDIFARISGTNGISGASDSMWVLAKERREDENAVLAITGRDIEQNEFTLQFDKRSCMWRNLGNTDDFTAQQVRAGYENNSLVVTVRKLLEQNADHRWSGTASDLMTAGKYITRTFLASSTKALAKTISELERPMLDYDGILHTITPNGNAGKKHHFSYQNAPEFTELSDADQKEMPFS